MRALGLALAATLLAGPVWAQAGAATGQFKGDAGSFALTHAVALSQDNLEGLLDKGPQIRLVLSQEDVPAEALYGVAFPPVTTLARKQAAHGIMLEFAPKAPTEMHMVILARPADPRASLTNSSISNSQGLFKRLEVTATRVSGQYEGEGMSFTFDAPLAVDAVQADLKGPAAVASEPVKVLLARADAIARGDLAAALAVSAESSSLRSLPPEQFKQAAAMGREMVKELKATRRVVIRQHTAVVLGSDGGFSNLVRDGAAWKVAD
ncbi:hypothetical protein [Phenylobacterium sp.]|jgi:hypothetical protein|uniref:hypothetical protein n=1 Tax=Phenylobacterium sp. TaxID=1871053 RepID=UPI002F41CFF8